METSGISLRLVNLANSFVGFIRGGLAVVTVVASMIQSEISGSSVADAAAIGNVVIPAMEKRGYPRALSLISWSTMRGTISRSTNVKLCTRRSRDRGRPPKQANSVRRPRSSASFGVRSRPERPVLEKRGQSTTTAIATRRRVEA